MTFPIQRNLPITHLTPPSHPFTYNIESLKNNNSDDSNENIQQDIIDGRLKEEYISISHYGDIIDGRLNEEHFSICHDDVIKNEKSEPNGDKCLKNMDKLTKNTVLPSDSIWNDIFIEYEKEMKEEHFEAVANSGRSERSNDQVWWQQKDPLHHSVLADNELDFTKMTNPIEVKTQISRKDSVILPPFGYSCALCEMTFMGETMLNNHMKNEHSFRYDKSHQQKEKHQYQKGDCSNIDKKLGGQRIPEFPLITQKKGEITLRINGHIPDPFGYNKIPQQRQQQRQQQLQPSHGGDNFRVVNKTLVSPLLWRPYNAIENLDGSSSNHISGNKLNGSSVMKKRKNKNTKSIGSNNASINIDLSVMTKTEKFYKCSFPKCNEQFQSAYKKKKHLITAHAGGEKIDQSYQKPFIANSEQKEISSSAVLDCFKCNFPSCNSKFTSRYKRMKHLIMIHNNNGMPIQCDKCLEKFILPHHLTSHSNSSFPKEQDIITYPENCHRSQRIDKYPFYVCSFPGCMKIFSRSYARNRHYRTVHNINNNNGSNNNNISGKEEVFKLRTGISDKEKSTINNLQKFFTCPTCGGH